MKKLIALTLMLALFCTVFAGCAAPAPAPAEPEPAAPAAPAPAAPAAPAEPEAPAEQELTKVRIGSLPFFDYTLLVAAKGVGLDKEMGLDFEIVPFALENVAVQALINGSIDIAQGSIASFYPVWPQTPELRHFLNNDQTMGFTIMARTGSGLKSFDEMLEEHGGDYDAAQKATLAQMKGLKIATLEANYLGTINGALAAGGLESGDLEIMNFANDGQSCAAFQSGECDLYMGGMNNTLVLLEQPDQYFSLAMGNELGVGGFWLSGTATTEEYLTENRDTVMKIMAVHYRACELLKQDPETFVPYQLDYLREHASSDLTLEQGVMAMQELVDFETLDASKDTIYNPESPLYWRNYADYYLDQNYSSGAIPEGSINIDEVVLQEQLFFEFLEHEDLVDYVYNGLN